METEHKKILPIAPGLFSEQPYKSAAPTLLGDYCSDCNRSYFPRRKFCPYCLLPTQEISIGSKGTIYSYTVVRTKPPFGLPEPYSVVYVDLEKTSLRVFGLFDSKAIDELRIGLEVMIDVKILGHDGHGDQRLRPFFKPFN